MLYVIVKVNLKLNSHVWVAATILASTSSYFSRRIELWAAKLVSAPGVGISICATNKSRMSLSSVFPMLSSKHCPVQKLQSSLPSLSKHTSVSWEKNAFLTVRCSKRHTWENYSCSVYRTKELKVIKGTLSLMWSFWLFLFPVSQNKEHINLLIFNLEWVTPEASVS